MSSTTKNNAARSKTLDDDDEPSVPTAAMPPVIVVKVGGSSITDKGTLETLQPGALEWLAEALKKNLDLRFLAPQEEEEEESDTNITDDFPPPKVAYILVHGAGSFGHFHAKKYGLRGVNPLSANRDKKISAKAVLDTSEERTRRRGLALTRQSVQLLNHLVVQALVQRGINAVGISPGVWSNTTTDLGRSAISTIPDAQQLRNVVAQTLRAGLIPVLHGDGCIFEGTPGILSGDIVVQLVVDTQLTQKVVFLTDVPGVFTADPKQDASAVRIPYMHVVSQKSLSRDHHTSPPPEGQENGSENKKNSVLSLPSSFAGWSGAGSSMHEHDVTGGLATKLDSAVTIVQETQSTVAIAHFGSSTAKVLLSATHVTKETTEAKDFEGTVLFPSLLRA